MVGECNMHKEIEVQSLSWKTWKNETTCETRAKLGRFYKMVPKNSMWGYLHDSAISKYRPEYTLEKTVNLPVSQNALKFFDQLIIFLRKAPACG